MSTCASTPASNNCTNARGEAICVVHVFTIALSLMMIKGFVTYFRERGMRLIAICADDETEGEFADPGLEVHYVPMSRRPSPISDVRALFRLIRLMRRLRPEIVHTHTAKGGLLGMLAATLCRSPVRIYSLRGLRFSTLTGWHRKLLIFTDWLSCTLSHRVLCVSRSVWTNAIATGICSPKRSEVLLHGSLRGVDAERLYDRARFSRAEVVRHRKTLGVDESDIVVGYVGRIAGDKGIHELQQAWVTLRDATPLLRLLLIGEWDATDPVGQDLRRALCSDPRVSIAGIRKDMPLTYATMDILVLPSYREGLSNVLLEAQAMELPIVTTEAVGCVDAVESGRTAKLVPVRDAKALAEALREYVFDPELRRKHGIAGRQMVIEKFSTKAIMNAIYQEYIRLLREQGVSDVHGGFRQNVQTSLE